MADDSDAAYEIRQLRHSVERIERSNEEFQTRLLKMLEEMAVSLHFFTKDNSVQEKLDNLASDLSVIADRYRPILDDD